MEYLLYLQPWEDRMKTANEQGTLVLLQNLDPTYTSAEVEVLLILELWLFIYSLYVLAGFNFDICAWFYNPYTKVYLLMQFTFKTFPFIQWLGGE